VALKPSSLLSRSSNARSIAVRTWSYAPRREPPYAIFRGFLSVPYSPPPRA
jgi:hypothetical protein